MKLIVKKPLITEKNTVHNTMGIYVFEVEKGVTKPEIKTAIEKSFGVKVESVNTSICRGRAKTNKFGPGRTAHWKKALVRLKQGEKIALFEGV